ncbi:hypothetical protein [Actinokineospora enzanensis]|uniref:hypothetical protein n=1 Tax=Actinokineospora enzanensis TaxID=155975 RepID=UPI0012EC1BCF|nr:hypothetical protein [Actinokineospora enzanensis]
MPGGEEWGGRREESNTVLPGIGTCAGYPAARSVIRAESERTGRDSPSGILTLLSATAQTILVIGPTSGGLQNGVLGLDGTPHTTADVRALV